METFDVLNFEIVDLSDLTDSDENASTNSRKKKKDGGCGFLGGSCNPGCGCGPFAGSCGKANSNN